MRRSPVLTLCALGLFGLSCQVTLPSPGANGLVDAAPHEAGTTSGPNVDDVPEATAEADALTPSEFRVLAELRRRHTALADHELVDLARTIVEESRRHDFEPALVMAVIHVESGGFHMAVSHVGALGLMQLMPPTGEELARKLDLPWNGPDTLFDPVLNVKLGVAYLRQLTDRYDSMPTALAAYNWGPGRIDRRIRRGAKMPSKYIELVMKAYDVPDARSTRS